MIYFLTEIFVYFFENFLIKNNFCSCSWFVVTVIEKDYWKKQKMNIIIHNCLVKKKAVEYYIANEEKKEETKYRNLAENENRHKKMKEKTS